MRRTVSKFLVYPAILLCLLVLLLTRPCKAQQDSVALSGAVQDQTSAVIPDVEVKITNSATAVTRQVKTNRSGQFSAPGLLPGNYSVHLEHAGFAAVEVTGITLQVGDNRNLDIKMQVGQAAQSVTVDGSGPTINTTDGSVGTVVDRQFVENTPLNGRSFQDLILLTPGVVTSTPQANPPSSLGNNGDFSVNGQRAEANTYIVDGVSGNTNAGYGALGNNAAGNIPSSTALGTTQSLVSVDALQEFRVNSSSYSAEYGRTPGGQFSFVTRSGTDDWHGSVYDYLRNNYFDANNWFTDYYHTPAPALRQNDFGGTLGGPVQIPHLYNGKSKSFFFVSYEGLRLTQPQPASLNYVPSLVLRQNPLLPAALLPALNAFPLPTPGGIDYGNGAAEFIQTDSLPSQIDSTSIRFNQVLSSKLRLFFRFSDVPSSTANRSLSVYEPSTSSSHTYTLGATAQLSANITDEFRLGYVSSNGAVKNIMDSFGGAQPINLAQTLGANTPSPNADPEIILSFPGTFTALSLDPSSQEMRQWNPTDTLSWLRGRHSIKLGFDYRYIESTAFLATPGVEYNFRNESQVLANKANTAIAIVSDPKVSPTYREFSAFAQDEWRPRPRLSLSFGLRWEVNPSPGASNGVLPYTLDGSLSQPSSLSLAPQGTRLWKTTWYNLAPRLGIAWTANNNAGYQTVLRAGGGVFFDTGNETASLGYGAVGFSARESLSNAPAPFPGGINLTPSANPPYTSIPVYAFYPHLQLPYSLEWSAAIEQELGQAQTLTISYVASNGRRLIQENESSITSLNPNFGVIVQYTNGPTSNYQALQTKFQRSARHGLQALVSYTWSHAFDYGSNYFSIPLQRGNSDFDVRNNFTGGVTWQSPKLSYGRAVDALLNTWAVDAHFIARSGFPVNIEGNEAIDSATGAVYYGGVDLVPNQPLYLNVKGLPGGREINQAAFMLPTGSAIGNAPRNFVRGFGAAQLNLAIRREFLLRDGINLQFRAESFNTVNHPTFGTIDSTLTDTTFGQATATLNQSLATTSSLYQMGGPRSMQFALKLQF